MGNTKAIQSMVNLFSSNAKELWMTGGAVRDKVLGKQPHDIDFATNATPEEMVKMAQGSGLEIWYSENGIVHGTIVWRIDGVDYEVTTFRKDVACDGRNATIRFADNIHDDLSRRDFTMNAMAINMMTGKLFDPFNGFDDIKNKTIRFVGDAEDRIREDRLRILRAFRFLSQMGRGWCFAEPITNADFDNLSKERIRDELLKMFSYNPLFAIKRMTDLQRGKILPNLEDMSGGNWHCETIKQHCEFALVMVSRITKDPLVRLATYLHDYGKLFTATRVYDNTDVLMFHGHESVGADKVNEWMRHMKFSNKDIAFVTILIANHMSIPWDDPTVKSVKKFIRKIGDEMVFPMMMLHYADRTSNLSNVIVTNNWMEFYMHHPMIKVWDEIQEQEGMLTLSDLKIDGNDFIKLGLSGKEIGIALDFVFNKVDSGEWKNDRDFLLNKVVRKSGCKPDCWGKHL